MSTVRVITPHALPMFREDKPRSTRRAMEKARKDPVLSKQPDLPIGSKGDYFYLLPFRDLIINITFDFRFWWSSGCIG